jgi:hypothetical protein
MDVVTVAIAMGLLPLAFLGVLRARGQRRDVAWLWLAIAFAVSWLADVIADVLPVADRWIVSLVYPVSQTALVAAVLMTRRHAVILLGVLVLAGCAAVLFNGVTGPDIVLRSVAWLSIVAIVIDRHELPTRLQWCLFVYFGIGWFAWLVHAQWLIVPTWYAYQTVRLAGLLLFCFAAMKPGPSLRLVRAA